MQDHCKTEKSCGRENFNKPVLRRGRICVCRFVYSLPIFNGPDLARLFAINDQISLEEALVKQEQADTIYSVARSYLDAHHKRNLLTLIKLQFGQEQEHFFHLKAQWKKALIEEVDYLQAQQRLADLEFNTKRAQLDYDSAIAELGLMMGVTNTFLIEEIDSMPFKIVEKDHQVLLEIALKQRPDLRAQRQAFKVASRDRLGGILQFLPNLSAQIDANYTNNTKGLVSEPVTFAFMFNASYSFFNGGKRFGELKESALKKQAEEIKINQLARTISAQILGRLQSIDSLELVRQSKTAMLNFATEFEENINNQYRKGLSRSEDLLNAKQQKFNAEISLKKFEADFSEEHLGLIYELGLLSPRYIN